MKVIALHRYAVKGLSPDVLEAVELTTNSFPHDRRYALHQVHKRPWKSKWLHKENFVCAFTHPKLLAQFESHYTADDGILTLYRRRAGGTTTELVLTVNMETEADKLARFLSKETDIELECLSGGDFQFGNTHLTAHEDVNARTIHVVFSSTVRELEKKVGIPLNPSRFRPNIIVQTDAPPFTEFSYMDRKLCAPSGLQLKVIDKAVRCKAVTVDPLDCEASSVLDIPELLAQHFPEHGPYLGVYCTVESTGTLNVGDSLTLVD